MVRSVDPSLDAVAERLISEMPQWTPGRQKGEAVRVKYAVPISFKLNGSKDSEPAKASPSPVAYGTFTPDASAKDNQNSGVIEK